jgi:hypothetical protein
MNAEHLHQIYGGDIADYINLPKEGIKAVQNTDQLIASDNALESIYDSQVKQKGAIDTSNIYVNRPNMQSLIERQPDKFEQMLSDTLNRVAREIGAVEEIPVREVPSVQPKEQTQDDIRHAQDEIARAMAELKDLGAL